MHPDAVWLAILAETLFFALVGVMIVVLFLWRRTRNLQQIAARQAELLQKQKPAESGQTSESHASHVLRMVRHLRALYDERFGRSTPLPKQVDDPVALAHLVHAIALQVLGKEMHAISNNLETEATWHEIQATLLATLKNLEAPVAEPPEETTEEEIPELVDADIATESDDLVPSVRSIEILSEVLRNALIDPEHESDLMRAETELRRLQTMLHQLDDRGAASDANNANAHPAPHYEEDFEGDAIRGSLVGQLFKNQNEMKELRNKLAGQSEMVNRLQYRLDQGHDEPEPEELKSELAKVSRMLAESEMCITTLESELDDLHHQIRNLEKELSELRAKPSDEAYEKEKRELNLEIKELRNCINTLEDAMEGERARIRELETETANVLAENVRLRDLLGTDDELPLIELNTDSDDGDAPLAGGSGDSELPPSSNDEAPLDEPDFPIDWEVEEPPEAPLENNATATRS